MVATSSAIYGAAETKIQIEASESLASSPEINTHDWAWLAGFWDGEGSIGIVRDGTSRHLRVQLSHTEYGSTLKILKILEDSGIGGRGYTYQERDPSKHRDAHYIRVSGMGNIYRMSKLIVDFAVTKRRHWEIAIEWVESRAKKAGGFNADGSIKRIGNAEKRKYTENEVALFEELHELNRRGPEDRIKRKQGRIK